MHPHGFGNVVQHQRLHRLVAVFEEGTLVLDDLGGDLHQCFVATEQALDEPARFLQLVAHEGIVGTRVGALYEAGVLGIDAKAGHGVWLSSTNQRSLCLRTMTSGTTYSGSLASICEPGEG